ncbi:hypothetical protein EHI89_10960 [Cronobacter sakazakii]|nr:hypothetical protein [Cronobacter sakazakii]
MATGQSADEAGSEHALVPEAAMTTPVREWSDDAFIRLMKDLMKQQPKPQEQKHETDPERRQRN